MLSFFFNDTATTEIYTLSLHDALPISYGRAATCFMLRKANHSVVLSEHDRAEALRLANKAVELRSEEHTSELQSRQYLVCRLLLEKKKKISALSCVSFSTFFRNFCRRS